MCAKRTNLFCLLFASPGLLCSLARMEALVNETVAYLLEKYQKYQLVQIYGAATFAYICEASTTFALAFLDSERVTNMGEALKLLSLFVSLGWFADNVFDDRTQTTRDDKQRLVECFQLSAELQHCIHKRAFEEQHSTNSKRRTLIDAFFEATANIYSEYATLMRVYAERSEALWKAERESLMHHIATLALDRIVDERLHRIIRIHSSASLCVFINSLLLTDHSHLSQILADSQRIRSNDSLSSMPQSYRSFFEDVHSDLWPHPTHESNSLLIRLRLIEASLLLAYHNDLASFSRDIAQNTPNFVVLHMNAVGISAWDALCWAVQLTDDLEHQFLNGDAPQFARDAVKRSREWHAAQRRYARDMALVDAVRCNRRDTFDSMLEQCVAQVSSQGVAGDPKLRGNSDETK
jgi:hypothetical protein